MEPRSRRRSVITLKVVIETNGTESEHEKYVTWARQNAERANQFFTHGWVNAVSYDEDGHVLSFTGSGSGVSTETQELLTELLGDQPPDQSQGRTA